MNRLTRFVLSSGAVAAMSINGEGAVHKTGLVKARDRHLGNSYVSLFGHFVENLPESYDLRDYGWVSPVRNQGGCGSCWSFGTVDSLESSMRMFGDHDEANLSTQQLVNCYFYGCRGGYFAFDEIKNFGVPPSSLEPYRGRDGSCNQRYSQEITLDTSMNLGAANRSPTKEEIKSAIFNFGAVAVTVVGGGPMQSYIGGVPSRCSNAGTDHIVTLIGWNKNGTWILKNSWGTNWGEKGFGNWPVGCDRVGEEAAVSIYKGVPVSNMLVLANLPKYIRPGTLLSVPYNPEARYEWYLNGKLTSLNNELNIKPARGDSVKVRIIMPDSITESETIAKL